MTQFLRDLKTGVVQGLIDVGREVSAPMTVSNFREKGEITPVEFERAGDALVQCCPSWKWESGDPAKAQNYLPKTKQFLMTRGVPCSMRISTLENQVKGRETKPISVDGDDGWYETSAAIASAAGVGSEIQDIENESKSNNADSDDDVVDIDDMDENDLEVKDDEDSGSSGTFVSNSIIPRRTYDMSITYDNWYHTPRVWLSGYDENRRPLKPEEVLQDISSDHANKTVTISAHPNLGFQCAYVHPCKHAEVMKKIVERQIEAGKEPRVDQYMFIFLKFLSAVLPTMEYDYTMDFKS